MAGEVSASLANEAMAKLREAQGLCEELGDFEEGKELGKRGVVGWVGWVGWVGVGGWG